MFLKKNESSLKKGNNYPTTTAQFFIGKHKEIGISNWLVKSARVYHKAQERRGQQALHRQVEWAKGVVLAVPPGSRTKH